jgi:hypothetical protein
VDEGVGAVLNSIIDLQPQLAWAQFLFFLPIPGRKRYPLRIRY